MSKEAVKARMEDLTSGAKGLTISDDLEKTAKERADLFYSFVKKRRDDGVIPKTEKDMVMEADRLEVKDKAPLILCELLFDANILAQVLCEFNVVSRIFIFTIFGRLLLLADQDVRAFADAFYA